MTYMLLDSVGNAINAFGDELEARAALRAIAEAQPDAADHVLLLAYDEDGHPIGEALTVHELPEMTTDVAPSAWTLAGALTTGVETQATNRRVDSSVAVHVVV
jgi:hypothetical protein